MAGAVPSINSNPSPTSDVAAGISAAIALLVVMGLVVARQSRPAGPLDGFREADRGRYRGGLVGFWRAAKYRTPQVVSDVSGDGHVEARLGMSETRRPFTRLWPSPAPRQAAQSPQQEASTCAICNHGFGGASSLRELPCGHLCHPTCVASWLNEFEITCPLCQVDLTAAYVAEAVPVPKRAMMAAMQRP